MKTGSVEFPLTKFRQFLDNSISFAEIKKYILYENFYPKDNEARIFEGKVDFPLYIGIKPDLKIM